MSTDAMIGSLLSLNEEEGIARAIEQLRNRAARYEQRIILTDGEDPRILAAVSNLQGFSRLRFVLVGRTSVILSQMSSLDITQQTEIYDPSCDPRQDQLIQLLQAQFERRRKPIPDTATLTSMAL